MNKQKIHLMIIMLLSIAFMLQMNYTNERYDNLEKQNIVLKHVIETNLGIKITNFEIKEIK